MRGKDDRELLFWCGIVFLAQVAMLLLQSMQFLAGETYQPLLYLYGEPYDAEGFHALEQDMWLINISLYCVMALGKMTRQREEKSYMAVARYPSFRAYYRMAYISFIRNTLAYQVFVFLGAMCGYGILWAMGKPVSMNLHDVMLSQICMMMGNLFLGILIFYCVLRRGAVKMAVVVYPGMPVLALVFGKSIPVMINNFFPGSWMMLGKSGAYSEGGFSLGLVLLVEMVAFLVLSGVGVRSRRI